MVNKKVGVGFGLVYVLVGVVGFFGSCQVK
jgi:hypothetical protein